MEHQIQFQNHMGEMLAGTLHLPEKKSMCAVIAGHCFTCSRHTGILRRICRDLSDVGFMALRFDFSGNGQSQGTFEQATWSKQVFEMEAAMALMKEKGATWIGLAGHSLGAAIALLTASQNKNVSAACRIAGRVSTSRNNHFLTSSQKRELEKDGRVEFVSRGRSLMLSTDFFEDAASHDLAAATGSLTIPMLVVHGDNDEVIPVSEAHFAKATHPDKVELCIVAGGDHMLSLAEHQQQVGRTVAEWFRHQAAFFLKEDQTDG